jgi:transcriptional regulator with XRE-family HTH domain
MLVATSIATVDRVHMPKRKRQGPGDGIPPHVKKEEGLALWNLWERRKRRTQAEFMESIGYSSGYLPQFFGGKRPISIDLAVAIANELKVDIADFSPRLAKDMDKAVEASGWPFKRFTRHQYRDLTQAQKEAVEAFVVAYLSDVESSGSRKMRRIVEAHSGSKT